MQGGVSPFPQILSWLQQSCHRDFRLLHDMRQSHHPGLPNQCDRVAAWIYTAVSPLGVSLDEMMQLAESIPERLVQEKLARRVAGDLEVWRWRDRLAGLEFTLSMLSQSNTPVRVILVENLSGPYPDFDMQKEVISAPERSLFTSAVKLLGMQNKEDGGFYAVLMATLSNLRISIRSRSLPISSFLSLKYHSPSQRTSFLSLLTLEVNDDPDEIKFALYKAEIVLEEYEIARAKMNWVREKYGESLGMIGEEGVARMEILAAVPLNEFQIPQELNYLLNLAVPCEFNSIAESLFCWVNCLLHPLCLAQPLPASRVFPVRQTEFIYASISHLKGCVPTEEIQFCCERYLLSIANPELLLLTELSSSSPDHQHDLIERWQRHHDKDFANWLSWLYEINAERGKIAAVFTRDLDSQENAPGQWARIESRYERADSFGTVEQLEQSVESFLASKTQKLYILDIRTEKELRTAKSFFESESTRVLRERKFVVLLIRFSRTADQVTGLWDQNWDVVAIERLDRPFAGSSLSLSQWLHQDVSTTLHNFSFFGSKAEAILQLVYSRLSLPQERKAIATQIASCTSLVRLLHSKLENVRVGDWRTVLLGEERLLEEKSLKTAAERVFVSQAADVLLPIIATVEHYNAFPSYLQAISQPSLRSFWSHTFRKLQPIPVPTFPSFPPLRYPFIQKDYKQLISELQPLSEDGLNYLCMQFERFSEANCHVVEQAKEVENLSILMDLYLEDLARLDLAESKFWKTGTFCYFALCGKVKSLTDVIKEFARYRPQISLLCSTMADELKQGIQDKTIRKIIVPENSFKAPIPTKKDIIRWIAEFEEEIAASDGRPLNLFSLQGGNLLTYNCVTHESTQKPLGLDIRHPSIIWVDPQRLLICGGEKNTWFTKEISRSTYSVGSTAEVTPLMDMNRDRDAHGLARVGDWVYAVGGLGFTPLKGCEKYSLKAFAWSELVSTMQECRHSFTPCVYQSQIYLSGGRSPYIEILDPVTDSITALSISLPESLSSVSVINKGKLILLWREGGREVDLETGGIVVLRDEKKFLSSATSVCEPVSRNGEIYWIDQEGGVTWINITSFQVVKDKA